MLLYISVCRVDTTDRMDLKTMQFNLNVLIIQVLAMRIVDKQIISLIDTRENPPI